MPIAASVVLSTDVTIHHPDLVNLYGCAVGAGTRIGAFVEIQKNASIGARCKISSHSFICEGVVIEDEVFVGHGVMLEVAGPFAASADGRHEQPVTDTNTEERHRSTPTGAPPCR